MRRRSDKAGIPVAVRHLAFVDLDVATADGETPTNMVRRAVGCIAADGVVVLATRGSTTSVVEALRANRWKAVVASEPDGHWIVCGSRDVVPSLLDVCDLEPPGPLEAVLDAAQGLAPGATLVARVPRYPALVFPHLEKRKLAWETTERTDGSVLIWLRKPA